MSFTVSLLRLTNPYVFYIRPCVKLVDGRRSQVVYTLLSVTGVGHNFEKPVKAYHDVDSTVLLSVRLGITVGQRVRLKPRKNFISRHK